MTAMQATTGSQSTAKDAVALTYNGKSRITQPTTIATAMKPPNNDRPNFACSGGVSFVIVAKISDTKNANTTIRPK